MTIEKLLPSDLQESTPPFFQEPLVYNVLEEAPLLSNDEKFKPACWTVPKPRRDGFIFPQTIAHRGFKAKYAENTMSAFKGAVSAGAHAIETDLHLSQDGIVVLSHDSTLKRCYGNDRKIIDCDWSYLSKQRTLQAPHEPMPRLSDLLEYLAFPGREEIWLLLDIKPDNDANDVMRLIAEAIQRVPAHPQNPWNQRVVLGCWAAKYIPLCATYLPSFPISHIGFSVSYARQFLSVPNVSFNLLQKALMGPWGANFLRDAKAAGRPVFGWTVNDEDMMRWSIKHELDGVITDDTEKFLAVCDDWKHGKRTINLGWLQFLSIVWLHISVMMFGMILRKKYPFRQHTQYQPPQGRVNWKG